jgi:hypothetical protein
VTPKLTLNIKTAKDEASAATERVKSAAKKKADATETIERGMGANTCDEE